MAILLDILGLEKSYTKGNPVLSIDELSLTEGTTLAVVGESGSGKTTLMRLIAGLESPETGTISLNNIIFTSDTTMVSPEKREIGMVFQDYALFPHLTVYENIGYGISKKEGLEERVYDLLKLVELEGYENRYPYELSGGQQQRVALARALAPRPKLLILDEPFSNLDTSLKLQLRNEVFSILKKTNVTTLFVTHDIDDAISMADEIVVLKNGRVIQKGTIEILYKTPVNLYIASLFSPVEKFNESQLTLFGFPPKHGNSYMIRQADFIVNKESKFMTNGIIKKSNYQGTHYLNTLEISHNYTLHFASQKKLDGTIKIGFERDSLIIFEEEVY